MTKGYLFACVKEGKIMFVVNELFHLLKQEDELRDEFYTIIIVGLVLKITEKARMNGTITWQVEQPIISQSGLTIVKIIHELPENVIE